MINTVQRAEKNRKYLFHYFNTYLKPEIEAYQKLSKINLEYLYSLSKEDLPTLVKNELFQVLKDEIVICKKLPGADKEYISFLEELAGEANISLSLKDGDMDFIAVIRSSLEEKLQEDCETEQEDEYNFHLLSMEERKLLYKIVKREKLNDVMFFIKTSFWVSFFILKHSLDRMLDEEYEYVALYARNRKRYKNSVEKYYSSYDFIGLLKVYLQIIHTLVTATPKNPVDIKDEIVEINLHMNALNFYSTPEIPYMLTAYFDMDPAELKKRLKQCYNMLKSENMQWIILQTAQTDKEGFQDFVSCLKENPEPLFGRILFAIYSALQITG